MMNTTNRLDYKKRLRIRYIVADTIAAVVTWILFLGFRWVVNDNMDVTYPEILIPIFNFYTPLLLYPAGCLLVHYLSGYYMSTHKRTIGGDIGTTLVTSLIISFAAFFIIIIDDIISDYTAYYYSMGALLCFQFCTTLALRTIITIYVRQTIKCGKRVYKVAIIGTGEKARQIAREVEKNLFGHKVIGYITIDKGGEELLAQNREAILGGIDEMEQIKDTYEIQSVIIALDDEVGEVELFSIIAKLYPHNLSIQFTPRMYEIVTGIAQIKRLGLSPLVNITEHSMPDWQLSIKRFMDIVLSIVALILFAPMMAICAICIKCDSRGSIFYKQERIGRLGKPFDILKFRTMYEGSENGTPQLSAASDSRVTKVGHILRKYRIDEIPQFWNVLKGEMSWVGPRPERTYYIEQIMKKAPYYCLVYKIRPGLTSWGPIKIGYSDTVDKMVDRLNYDIIYMENMSLMNDLKILLYTIEVIVKGKGQ